MKLKKYSRCKICDGSGYLGTGESGRAIDCIYCNKGVLEDGYIEIDEDKAVELTNIVIGKLLDNAEKAEELRRIFNKALL